MGRTELEIVDLVQDLLVLPHDDVVVVAIQLFVQLLPLHAGGGGQSQAGQAGQLRQLSGRSGNYRDKLI